MVGDQQVPRRVPPRRRRNQCVAKASERRRVVERVVRAGVGAEDEHGADPGHPAEDA